MIEQTPLEIDTELQIQGRPPTMVNSEFLTNKEQGDWAEEVVFKAINEFSDEYFAIKYGRSERLFVNKTLRCDHAVAPKAIATLELAKRFNMSRTIAM